MPLVGSSMANRPWVTGQTKSGSDAFMRTTRTTHVISPEHLAPGHPRQEVIIDFVVVSSDLWPHVLETQVKRGAVLSTDHHLVAADWYHEAKRATAAVVEAKTRAWEKFGEASANQRFVGDFRPLEIETEKNPEEEGADFNPEKKRRVDI
ncbi:hypothetical protein AMECASPLE_008902 [Ameca splendens]|uniref:Uncharacterized protein n=1 Tax=Ameca splendens TaxID=208324 RepID=A0ABV0YC17_9TELE